MFNKRRIVLGTCGFLLGCAGLGLTVRYFDGTWAVFGQLLLEMGLFIACLVPAGLMVLAAYRFRGGRTDGVDRNANQH